MTSLGPKQDILEVQLDVVRDVRHLEGLSLKRKPEEHKQILRHLQCYRMEQNFNTIKFTLTNSESE